MEFRPFDGDPPVVTIQDDEDDEVAEAVLELKELTAAQGTELQAIAAKLGRAENEVQALKTEMAELRAAVAAGAAAAPAEATEQAAPVEEAVTPPPKKGRLQRAAEKRKAISEPSGPSEPAIEVSEPPATSGRLSPRAQGQMTAGAGERRRSRTARGCVAADPL